MIRELANPPEWRFSESQLFGEFLMRFSSDYTSVRVGFNELIQQECVKRSIGDQCELTQIGRQKLRDING